MCVCARARARACVWVCGCVGAGGGRRTAQGELRAGGQVACRFEPAAIEVAHAPDARRDGGMVRHVEQRHDRHSTRHDRLALLVDAKAREIQRRYRAMGVRELKAEIAS